MILYDNKYSYRDYKRIVVIGDIHGDIKRFKNILIDASVINSDLEWIADPPETIIVQIGDQIDSLNRVPHIEEWEVIPDINMLYLTNSLNKIANTKGGKVISLVGNHELMNVMGNFSYVSDKSNFHNRIDYFKPEGTLSEILANMKIVVKINDLIFCHAGLRKKHLDLLDKLNINIPELNRIWNNFILDKDLSSDDIKILNRIIIHDDGILWTRNSDTQEDLDYVMNRLGCTFMFVGHTPSEKIQLIQSKIWYIDTCISRAFGSETYQYIDIIDKYINIKTITEK